MGTIHLKPSKNLLLGRSCDATSTLSSQVWLVFFSSSVMAMLNEFDLQNNHQK
uniref:Uncharacterized protein n=1 Tax=Arundo donax TaxID=35708 RepID=A0A0A9E3F4_ARUDO